MMSRTLLITGASSGIGLSTVRRFSRQGERIVLAARRTERLEAITKELHCPTHVLSLDVRDRAAVEKSIAGLPAEFADIDVLVNGAGLALGLEPAHEASLDDWDTMIDANIKGLVYVTRAVLPGMVARNRGHVVNISSVAASYPYPGGNVYGATKAFVTQFSLNLRADLIGKNVRVTDIEPGMTETEFSVVRFKGDDARAASVYRGVEVLSPDDVAGAVEYAVNAPAHVNINRIEMMPVMQAFSPFAVARQS
jgi:NADP-dependent 3-hydroxy acid dehydrogenase YdfG